MAKLGDTITGARIVGEHLLRSQRSGDPEGRMPLGDHLRELRSRLVKAILAVVGGMIVGFIFFRPVWHFVMRPYCETKINGKPACTGTFGHTLIVNGVFDGFYLHVKVALVFGLIITSPIWLYQLWAFIAPGLYAREKRWTYAFVGSAVPLFCTGAVFAYIAMSRALYYLISLVPQDTVALFTTDTYLNYFIAMVLGFGLAFELPLAIVVLNLAGIMTHARFKKWRRYMIFGVFVFAGIASPSPDPITMLMLAAPCAALVEVAEVVVWANDRRKARVPEPYAGLSDDETSPLDFDDSGGAARSPRDRSDLN
jgi:sec-independent protein translocase protein TatC